MLIQTARLRISRAMLDQQGSRHRRIRGALKIRISTYVTAAHH